MKNRVRSAEIVTGLSDFDALAGPLPRGRVTVVAARSSSGTTAFALGVARHNDEIGHRVAFASFESGTDTIMGNLVAAVTSVNIDRPLSIDKGRRARIERAREAMERSRLLMWSRALKTGKWPFENLMEQLAAHPQLALVVVDGYSQAAYGEPSEGATFAALEQLALKRDIAVLVTAHLMPQEDTPETDPPALSDVNPLETPVKEAQTAMILHRPDRHGTVPQRRGEVDLIAVHGWQDTGNVTVRFEPEYHRFVDLPNQ
ncbi:DnaB-like helicase C-terminal domain-containing protein [Streptomyces sp. TG1A-8]|uniref:DnaB-like helicase C-terminal domain-containing protein n=1 Tax=Streptomyces sp. TG1A-8 TaxID=3051385 RepID=UPI00265B94AB|nr:DnaB-like helicase C-terminal domain-containing protein [Streptomyces sp. TG1A-8]MDO0929738.1 DnaB-like helicase C-terminal domain-containing protein [Streptomyces sp. TG1A-8]